MAALNFQIFLFPSETFGVEGDISCSGIDWGVVCRVAQEMQLHLGVPWVALSQTLVGTQGREGKFVTLRTLPASSSLVGA